MYQQKFSAGDRVEVYCDHQKNGRRVRDWLQGVVVQADYRMAGIQFLANVYLTDGWMVPDRILWCAHGSKNIRPATTPRPSARKKTTTRAKSRVKSKA